MKTTYTYVQRMISTLLLITLITAVTLEAEPLSKQLH